MRQKTLSLLLLSLLLPVSLSAQTFRPRVMSGLHLTMLPGQTDDPLRLINSSGVVLALLNPSGRFEVAVLTNAGACTDAVFSIGTVGDGALCVDTSAGAFYFRTGGAWSAISPGGITSLNGLTGATQTFSTGTAGTNFGISSSGSVHTFNLPDASATARGLVTTGNQTFAGTKTTPIWNASTGFQIGGAAASRNVLEGDGTKFVARSAFQQIWRGGFYESAPATGLTTIPLPVSDQCAAGISVERVSVAAITKGSGTMTFQVTRYNSAGASQGNIFSGNQTYSNTGDNRQDYNVTTSTATSNDYFRFNIVTLNGQADVTFIVEGKCDVL